MIFTTSSTETFTSFKPNDIPYKDAKLSIFFETQEMMEDTLILLRFNCPDGSCDYIAGGWNDLKLHVRGSHGNLMWYELFSSPRSGCGLNHAETAIFALGRRKYSPMNTQHMLQTCCRTTYHLFKFAQCLHQKASTSKFIRCVSSVGNAVPVTTNCSRTCGRNMKNVLSANETGPNINSEYAPYDA